MKKKTPALLIAFIIIISAIYAYIDSTKEYIEGNILHLPITAVNAHNNILLSPWSQAGMFSGLMYRTLLIADETLSNFKNDLASSFEALDDVTFKITLKENQTWSDNTLITPQDIVFSVESILNSKDIHISNTIVKAFRKIKNMEIQDNSIIFTLTEAHFNFLPALAQFAIMPKHALENIDMAHFHTSDFWKNPIVSGLYKLDYIEEDAFYSLIPNKHYNGQAPKIEEVRLHMNYKSAPIDTFYTNNISEMMHYRAMRGYTEYPVSMHFIRYFVFNIQGADGYINPKMQDKRVREAICYAIDNKGLVDKIYFEVATTTTISAESDGFYEYNPQRAKELLEEANFDFSEPLRLAYYYSDSTSREVMNHLKTNLEAVGFNIELLYKGDKLHTLYTSRGFDVLLKGLASFNSLEWFEEYDANHPFLPNVIDTRDDFKDLLLSATTAIDPIKHKEVLENLLELDKEYLFKFAIYSPLQRMYVNSNRVQLPKDIVFANPWYISNYDFANWQIKKN